MVAQKIYRIHMVKNRFDKNYNGTNNVYQQKQT